MIGSEIQEGAHPLSPTDDVETLIINDPLISSSSSPSSSYATYKSVLTSISDSRHRNNPLTSSTVSEPAVSDPLLSPLAENNDPPISPRAGVVHNGSHFEDDDDREDYSDVFITPMGGLEVRNGGSRDSYGIGSLNSREFERSESLNSLSGEYLRIMVTNPQKEQEPSSNLIVPGGNSYVTYLVTTKTNLRGFGGTDFCGRRRFRDFVTLADRLAESYRGFFVPPRPDKSVVEGQVMHKQEFVEQRSLALEKYLRKLASHPEIRKSDELRVFLQVPGKCPLPTSTDVASRMLDGAAKLPKQLFGESAPVVAPHEAVQPAKGGGDLLRLFKELKQSVTNDWGNSKPPLVEEDKDFLEKKEKLHDFELRLMEVSKQAESLVKALQDMADTMGELGLSFIKLTKFENEAAVLDTQRARATELKNIATTSVKGCRIYRELNAKTVKNLTLLSELSTLQTKAEKLEATSSKVFDGHKSSHKMAELKDTVKVTEDSKNCAVREYERIKENNRSELERLEREKRVDFLDMLKGFVNDQVSCAEKMANLWSGAAEDTKVYAKESS